MNDIQIPGFEILEKLGEGGMATVWKARQLSLDRIVAIKILSSRLASDPADVSSFLKEAQTAASLKHPGIVQVHDATITEDLCFFIMEYIAGYTAGDWVQRKGALSEEDALLLADCVASALQYAMETQGVIHCDIKPDNIIIDADGTVKVADLGLARTISAISRASAPDEIAGTPPYMSPEQARGENDLDCRTDIYALGAMLYHLITGKALFHGHDDHSVLQMQVTKCVPCLLRQKVKISRGMCLLLETMLAKNRKDRPSDWAAVRRDISRVKRKMNPHTKLPPGKSSTIQRSEQHTVVPSEHGHPQTVAATATSTTSSPLLKVAIAAGIMLLSTGSLFLLSKLHISNLPAPPAQNRLVETPGQPTAPPKEHLTLQGAREMYEQAVQWAEENPTQQQEAIRRLRRVIRETSGTQYAVMAQAQIKTFSARRESEIESVLAELKAAVKPLIDDGEFLEAAQVYDTYDGRFARETQGRRSTEARLLRDRDQNAAESESQAAHAESKREELLGGTVQRILDQNLTDAAIFFAAGMSDADLLPYEEEFREIKDVLWKATVIDERILESFAAQTGQEVTVQLLGGPRTLVITAVDNGVVAGNETKRIGNAVTTMATRFRIGELSTHERLRRMGLDSVPEVALIKGMMALAAQQPAHARAFFAKTHPILAAPLMDAIDAQSFATP